MIDAEQRFIDRHGETKAAYVRRVIHEIMRIDARPCYTPPFTNPTDAYGDPRVAKCDEDQLCWRHETMQLSAERLLRMRNRKCG